MAPQDAEGSGTHPAVAIARLVRGQGVPAGSGSSGDVRGAGAAGPHVPQPPRAGRADKAGVWLQAPCHPARGAGCFAGPPRAEQLVFPWDI